MAVGAAAAVGVTGNTAANMVEAEAGVGAIAAKKETRVMLVVLAMQVLVTQALQALLVLQILLK